MSLAVKIVSAWILQDAVTGSPSLQLDLKEDDDGACGQACPCRPLYSGGTLMTNGTAGPAVQFAIAFSAVRRRQQGVALCGS